MSKKLLSEDRIKTYNTIKRELEKEPIIIKGSRLGKGEQGVVYKGTIAIPSSNNNKSKKLDLVIKKAYIEKKEAKGARAALSGKDRDLFSKSSLKFEPYIEIAATSLVTELVKQKVCPNFVMTYGYQFKERDTICEKKYPVKSILYNEWIPGVELFDTFCQNESHSIQVWFNAYFQILAGIHAMQNVLGMAHADLHSDNILVAKIPKGGHWKYTIDGVDYFVPNLGYQFLINDFGHAWIPGKMESWYVREELKPNLKKRGQKKVDPIRIFDQVLEYSVAPKRVKKIVDMTIDLLRKTDIEVVDLIYTIFGSYFLLRDPRSDSDKKENDKELNRNCKAEPYFCYFKKLKSKQLDAFNIDSGISKGDLPMAIWKLI
jgi:hypothetical protein